ncbi:MAG: 3-phosphoshikimate 1-carboxyvinyltransferase, partial [Thermodesulfobacteriota bacterium]|nr:3-phosphoshikimate 1-carboxyvinyltransferase [Thermodesulfobacteriota bacterium]
MIASTGSENNSTITSDPFIKGLLARIPKKNRSSFSDEQLLSLKIALSGRKWGHHTIDMRGTLGVWRWRYYYVLVGGREQRTLTRREEKLMQMANALALMTFLTFSVLLGILVIYLIKSALGIDLIPDYSFGVWKWFKG